MFENSDDAAILAAVKKRLLRELKEKKRPEGQGAKVSDDVRGMMMEGEDPYDYLVDIERRDLPDLNPHTGKPAGWTKKVHRHREKKG